MESLIWLGSYPNQIQGDEESEYTDGLHPSMQLYNHGQPWERDVSISLTDGSVDVVSHADHVPYVVADATLTAEVTLGYEQGVGNTWGGLVFRRKDASNYYAAILCLDTEEVVLQNVVDGEVTELAREAVADGLTAGVAATLAVVLSGTGITISVEATQEIDETDSTYSSGTYGVKTSSGSVTVGAIAVS